MTKELTEIGFKRVMNKKNIINTGYIRKFVKCKKCLNKAYYDFVPYSLSNPILTSPCSHHPFKDYYISF